MIQHKESKLLLLDRFEHNSNINDETVTREPNKGPFLFWWPVVDSYSNDPVLPIPPLEAFVSGQYNRNIPYITGTVKNDGALFQGLIQQWSANLQWTIDTWRNLGPRMLMWSSQDPTSEQQFAANIIRSILKQL